MRTIVTKILVLAGLALLTVPSANAHDGEIVRCLLDIGNCIR